MAPLSHSAESQTIAPNNLNENFIEVLTFFINPVHLDKLFIAHFKKCK
jgi:hypothetical protein